MAKMGEARAGNAGLLVTGRVAEIELNYYLVQTMHIAINYIIFVWIGELQLLLFSIFIYDCMRGIHIWST